MDSINGICYYLNKINVDAIKHSTDDNFSFRKTAMCVQHSPTAAARSRLIHHLSKNVIFVFPSFAR